MKIYSITGSISRWQITLPEYIVLRQIGSLIYLAEIPVPILPKSYKLQGPSLEDPTVQLHSSSSSQKRSGGLRNDTRHNSGDEPTDRSIVSPEQRTAVFRMKT